MAADITIQLVKEKLGLLQSNNEIIDPRLNSQVNDFNTTMDSAEKFLKDEAENNGGGTLNPDILQIVYRIEDAIDAFKVRKEFQKHNVFPYGMHLNFVFAKTRFLNKMQKLVDDLSKRSGIDQLKSSWGSSVQTNLILKGYSHENRTDILDVEDRTNELAKLILNKCSPFHIFVVEVSVSDRETMLSKIFNRIDIQGHFEYRASVRVPDEFDDEKLLFEVLEQVRRNETMLPDDSKRSPERELRNLLIQKKYLVVFTDVRTPEIWEILKYAFPDSSNGSRVIFSFREADAARNPDIKFFGRELLLRSEDIDQASSTKVEDSVEKNIDIKEGQTSEFFDYLVKETDIIGPKKNLRQLAQLTLNGDDKYSLISVVGVAGSGKTTLVKTIYNNPYIRQKFDHCAWVNVYVSHDFDMKSILIDILKQVKEVKDDEEFRDEDELEIKLTEILSGKKVLIVLDDVHLPAAWYELKSILLPGSKTGSRVILITRDTFVARCFGESNFVLKQLALGEEDSWKLFLKKVKRDDTKLDPKGNLKKQVWQKCQGLPLTICLLGGLLSNKSFIFSELPDKIEKIMQGEKGKDRLDDEHAASNDDKSISKDLISSFDKMDPSYIWTLGYKDLSPRLRAYLQYLCLFPKSYEIPVRRLFHLWVAERLVVTSEKEKIAPEDQVKSDFEELVRRNMIEVTKWKSDETAKTCSVPSTLYEVFRPNAEHMGFFHVHRESNSKSDAPKLHIRRLVEHFDTQNNSQSDHQLKNLRSYISFNTRRGDKEVNEVSNFLTKTVTKRGFGLLRVLDLERVYKPVLPESLGKLLLLCYVGLRWTFLDSIPVSVGDLPSLETLDVKHTNITTLPISIWKAKKLRHLYMNEIHFQMPAKTSFASDSLSNLQTLWGLLIGNIKTSRSDWLERSSSIRKLGLTCHKTSLEKITNWICTKLESLESLRLRSINDFNEPSDLNLLSLEKQEKLTDLYLLGKLSREIDEIQLPRDLKILTLSVSQLSDDPMPKLGKLQKLNILRLYGQSYIGEQMTCPFDSFPKLHVLKFWVLKELRKCKIEKKAMPELIELDIRYCKKLEEFEGLENVLTLKELTLTNMEKDFTDKVTKKMGNKIAIYVKDLKIDNQRVCNTHGGKESGVQ